MKALGYFSSVYGKGTELKRNTHTLRHPDVLGGWEKKKCCQIYFGFGTIRCAIANICKKKDKLTLPIVMQATFRVYI